MNSMQQAARKVIPTPMRQGLVRSYRRFSDNLEWEMSPKALSSHARMRKYRSKHAGERCFIIGNGPSLNQTDLSLLKNEFTFGLNRIYLLFPKLGFSTTYFVSINKLVIEQCHDEIEALPVPKFITWFARKGLRFTDDMIFVRRPPDLPLSFSKDPSRQIWEGATVTYVAMQLAYYMGFQKVILIGVDHSFTTKGPAHQTITSQGADLNHFSPEYFGKGFRWQLPDLETSELAYALAKKNFESDNREIVDATVGGKLEIFPKVNYLDLF